MSNYNKDTNLILVTCSNCGKAHYKNKYVYNKGIKLNRQFSCSPECLTVLRTKGLAGKRNTTGLNHINRVDEYTPFRYLLDKIKSRGASLSLQDIKNQWG